MKDCLTGGNGVRVWRSASELVANENASDVAAVLLVDGSTSERAQDLRAARARGRRRR
jgi:hypothetical protein